MVLDWLAKGKPTTVAQLLARKQVAKAVELAEAEHGRRPRLHRLRIQLADVYIASGRTTDAVNLLLALADELARDGFAAKSIAILKRVQKIQPGRSAVEERLAGLIQEHARQTPSPSARRLGPARPELGMEEIHEPPAGIHEPPVAEKLAEIVPELPDAIPPAVRPAPPSETPAAPPREEEEEFEMVELEELEETPPLGETPLFADFSREELLAVMRGLELLTFAPGDVIVAQGERGESLFVLTTGTVKAWVKDDRGHYLPVRKMKEGDFFGEIALLQGGPRTATVTAATPCELLELDRATLDGITERYPRVRDVLQRFYEQRTAP